MGLARTAASNSGPPWRGAAGHQTGDGQSQAVGASARSPTGPCWVLPEKHTGPERDSQPQLHVRITWELGKSVTPGPPCSGGTTWVSRFLQAPKVILKNGHRGSQISRASESPGNLAKKHELQGPTSKVSDSLGLGGA